VDENDRVRQLEIAEKEIEQEDTLSLSKNIHVPLTLSKIINMRTYITDIKVIYLQEVLVQPFGLWEN
jgi:hypothetical protein